MFLKLVVLESSNSEENKLNALEQMFSRTGCHWNRSHDEAVLRKLHRRSTYVICGIKITFSEGVDPKEYMFTTSNNKVF